MPFTPDAPFPKSQGDNIRSKDWNDAVNELRRLDADKLDISGGTITGPLSVSGMLTWGSSAARTETKDDAGAQASRSGFFETAAPVNYYAGATGWQHLIESRHSNNGNNFALQIAGSFHDQNLYMRKTSNGATTAWSRFVLMNSGGNVGIGTNTPDRALTIQDTAGTYLNVKGNGGAVEVLLGADAGGGIVSAMTAHDLQLRAGSNSTKAIIKANGNVGVGTTTPDDMLDVHGILRILTGSNPIRFTSAWSSFPDNATDRSEICNDTGTFKTLMIIGNKSAGLGRRVSVWDRLEVNGILETQRLQLGNKWMLSGVGDAHGNDGWLRVFNVAGNAYHGGLAAGRLWAETGKIEGSDVRLKKDVAQLGDVTSGVLALRGVRFKWRADGEDDSFRLGLIAQEVEEVFPELVDIGPGGMKGIYYSGLFAPLIEAVKQQQEQISGLRAELLELKAEREAGRDGGGHQR